MVHVQTRVIVRVCQVAIKHAQRCAARVNAGVGRDLVRARGSGGAFRQRVPEAHALRARRDVVAQGVGGVFDPEGGRAREARVRWQHGIGFLGFAGDKTQVAFQDIAGLRAVLEEVAVANRVERRVVRQGQLVRAVNRDTPVEHVVDARVLEVRTLPGIGLHVKVNGIPAQFGLLTQTREFHVVHAGGAGVHQHHVPTETRHARVLIATHDHVARQKRHLGAALQGLAREGLLLAEVQVRQWGLERHGAAIDAGDHGLFRLQRVKVRGRNRDAVPRTPTGVGLKHQGFAARLHGRVQPRPWQATAGTIQFQFAAHHQAQGFRAHVHDVFARVRTGQRDHAPVGERFVRRAHLERATVQHDPVRAQFQILAVKRQRALNGQALQRGR